MRRVLPVVAIVCALLGGCGDITYQTRYIPRASELTWNREVKQLPWRPPAIGATHYERTGRPDKPMYPAELQTEIDWPMQERHYAGDGDAADSGPLPPQILD